MANLIGFANYAETTLAAAITSIQTTITVTDASVFAATQEGAGYYFYLTLVDCTSAAANSDPPAQREIVKVTAVSGNTLTVVRGQDGTTAQAFAACDIAAMRFNAQSARDLRDTGGGGNPLTVEEEGVAVDSNVTVMNFTGSGVTASETSAGVVEINVPGGGGSAPDISYATVADESGTFSNARQLAAGTNITFTDGGPGGTLEIAAAGSGSGGAMQSQEFTSSDTFTVPTGVEAVWLTMIGGGGGGYGTGAVVPGGSGGGAGELLDGQLVPVTPAANITVTIGAAGAGGASGGNVGTGGGTTSFGPTWKVLGGGGGQGTSAGAAGAGGGIRGAAGGVSGGAAGILGTAETPTAFGGSSGGVGSAGGTGGAGGGSAGLLAGGIGGVLASTKAGGGGGAASRWGVGGAGGDGEVAGHDAPAGSYGAGGGGGGGSATGKAGGAGLKGYVLVVWIG